MIRERGDLHFVIIAKRIRRFQVRLPKDWGEGYDNVTICCTCENQNRADYRVPIFLNLPMRHRTLIHEPMLERIEIRRYLATGLIEQVTCSGESGPEARTIYEAIGGRNLAERRAVLHIFASAPNVLMFSLGQNLMGFGKCILYEYDFEQRNSCTYPCVIFLCWRLPKKANCILEVSESPTVREMKFGAF